VCCRASKRSRPLCFAGVELLSFSGQLPGLIFLLLLFWCGVQRYFAALGGILLREDRAVFFVSQLEQFGQFFLGEDRCILSENFLSVPFRNCIVAEAVCEFLAVSRAFRVGGRAR
jgi:hypothetical protein